ncbi:hypothetical protein B217_07052 [Bifidobacterium bifidum IPLA 20015]|nr:hypothetical protein B217_07052 [Bifidobacterium bifidum IPLA 20015]
MSMIMQFRWISETHPLAGRPSPRIIGLYVQRGMNSLACDFSIRLIRLNLAEWHVPHAEGTRAGVGASVFLMLCLTRRCLKLILHFWLVGSILGSILMMKTMRIVGTVVFCLIQTNRTNVFMRNTQLFITCAKH